MLDTSPAGPELNPFITEYQRPHKQFEIISLSCFIITSLGGYSGIITGFLGGNRLVFGPFVTCTGTQATKTVCICASCSDAAPVLPLPFIVLISQQQLTTWSSLIVTQW